MRSLLKETALLLLALCGPMPFQTASVTRDDASRSFRDVEGHGPASSVEMTSCDRYASCSTPDEHYHQCFCDRLCRLYDDCCSDYVDEEGGHPLTPLSPSQFTCTLMPDYGVRSCLSPLGGGRSIAMSMSVRPLA